MTTTETEKPKLPAVMRATQCFAHRDSVSSIIDMVNPDTGLSCVYGESLEKLRERYPDAVIRELDEIMAEKVKAQNTPIEWLDCTLERYDDMLNVLPPAAHVSGAFLVGEAADHSAETGRARFACFRRRNGSAQESSRPMTFAEFKANFGPCDYFYDS